MTRMLVILSALFAVAGCSGRLTPIAPAPPAGYVLGAPTKGSACGMLFLGVIPAGVNGRAERAYQTALKNGGGADGLVDTTVRDRWYYAYIGAVLCTDIEGTTYRLAAAPAS